MFVEIREAARLTACKITRIEPASRHGPRAWETGQMNSITYFGLDVHKTTIAVAVAEWPAAAYHHEQCTQEQPTRGVLPFPASGTT